MTRVSKVHSRVVALVLIGAPAVKDGLTIAVQVDKVSDVRKTIEEPDHVSRLGLGGRARTHVTLVITRFEGAAYRVGSKVSIEAPEKGIVSVDVHADAFRSAPLRCRAPVLPPPRRPLHAEVAAVRIHLRKDHDI